MRIVVCVLAFFWFAGAMAAEITVKVPIPPGATSLDMNFTVPDPEVEPTPPDVEVPPETEVPPVETAFLYWPDTRPEWCDEDVHFCISTDDTDANPDVMNAYAVSEDFTKPQFLSESEPPDAALGEACYHKAFSEKNTGLKDVQGIVVADAPNYKTFEVAMLCQPLPIDNAPAWKFQHQQGTHEQTINVSARYPLIFTGGAAAVVGLEPPNSPRPIDNRPLIDCVNGPTSGDHNLAGKGCIYGKHNTDVTVIGLKVRYAFQRPDGSWKADRGDQYYRCASSGTGKLTMIDTDLINCKHGVQGGLSLYKEEGVVGSIWEFTRVRMENCAFNGNGKTHCIYSDSPGFEGAAPHALISVTDSYLQTCGGHDIKSHSDKTTVLNSRLIEGSGDDCDSGAAIHNSAAMTVEMSDVDVEQSLSEGNTKVFISGATDPQRCRGEQNGIWTLKNVTVVDTDPRLSSRYKEECVSVGPGIWNDLGGNTVNNGTDAQGNLINERPLIVDGVPFAE